MEYISRTDHDGIARVVIRRGKVNAFNDNVIDEMRLEDRGTRKK